MTDLNQFTRELEALGEEQVRVKVAIRYWQPMPTKQSFAELWLSHIDRARELEASAKRDAREEKTLRLARWANIIAITAVAIASKDQIMSAISWGISWLR